MARIDEAIATLLQDHDLRRRLGQAARERAHGEFSHDKICPLLMHEYRRLLDELDRKNSATSARSGRQRRLDERQ